MTKFNMDDWIAVLPPGAKLVDPITLRASDNERHCGIFKQLIRDGVEINGILENKDNIPSLDITADGLKVSHFIWLFPESEKFVLRYLCTGDNNPFPKYLRDFELPEFRADEDYIDRHIKRELEREKYTYKEETHDDTNGIRFIGQYPYGSIDYGFFPYSWDEFNSRLETVEPFLYNFPEYEIPELHYTTLPIEYKDLVEGKHLDSVFKEIPTNTIIDKTICGCGATWLEIHSKRNSIIIEPNIPVIIGKEQQHSDKNLIGVYGEKLKAKEIAEKIQNQTGDVKIMTTPDSYNKVAEALKSLRIPYHRDYFLLFDECEKIVSDIDYRPNISLPIADFFKFQNKAMVSATPIVINDPKFVAQGFKIIKIQPLFDHKRLLELKPTNNVNAMVKRTVEKIDKDTVICFFYNSVKGIKELIDLLGIGGQSNIYCSTDAKKDLNKDGYNVFDSVTDKTGNTTLNKYNFFTSRFYSAVDIKLDYKPVVIMVTDVYKTIKDKTPYSLIDPETEAIQIAGRFRNGVERLIHITNTDYNNPIYSRDELEQWLNNQHSGFLKMVALYDADDIDQEEKPIIYQAITRTDYFAEGFVNAKSEINYFRYNNFYLDERLKMLYTYPAPLYKAYKRSGAFTVVSESEYALYTDEERRKLKDRNNPKAERIKLLYEIIKRSVDSDRFYDRQFINDLKQDYLLYFEAFATIGFVKVKELDFVDSDVRTAVNDFNFEKQVKSDKVIKAVCKVFKENTTYTVREVKDGLKKIYDHYTLQLHRQPQGKDIFYYFEGEEDRGARGIRVCKLKSKRY